MSNIELKQFLDFKGLEEYDKLIKEYVKKLENKSDEANSELIQSLAALSDEVDVVSDRVTENASAIDILNGDAKTEGSVDKKISDAISSLVDGAPEALDTLKEVADWISNDESGASTLVSRVTTNEEKIEELKAYVDDQDEAYFNTIKSIEDLRIVSLFAVEQEEDETVVEAIEALKEGGALELKAEQTIEEDLSIEKSCYIDAKGSTFEGVVTISKEANVIIENAIFSKPVIMA